MRILITTGLRRTASVAFATLAAFVLTPSAAAQGTHVAQANDLYKDITPARYSHPIILPALAEIEDAPAAVADVTTARLIAPGDPLWDEVERWRTSAPQRAVLEALRKVTEQSSFDSAMAFAQPYGSAGIPVELLRAGMYTELGDPPLLAAADHRYLDEMETMRNLVHVEATKLTTDGNVDDAAELLLRLAVFGRQMVEREFMVESYWGYRTLLDAISRVRDVLFMDFESGRNANPARLRAIIDWLDREGILGLDRLSFPRADRIGSQQLIDLVYRERGGVREAPFIEAMSRLGSGTRPLRRFAQSDRWRNAAGSQADWFDIGDALARVYDGWSERWKLAPGSPVLALPFPYWDYTDEAKYAVISKPLLPSRPEGGPLAGEIFFDFRKALDVERVGTKQAIGVLGRLYERGRYPPELASIRPRWIEVIEPDEYSEIPLGAHAKPAMTFFVPVRDDYIANRRDEAQPHFMQVFPGDGSNFGVELYDDSFVLYSVGPNHYDDNARRVHQDIESEIGDYLIWPPVQGLYRKHLRDTGQLGG
ncbi:MAG: hypothetical protein CMJ31_07520 [Phycisphaerae bacterium]|nr:hypothetical protein [Phycisphaerae bacterium]